MPEMSDPSTRRGVIHLDAVGGVAGDMFVAALLDCFPALHEKVFADIAAVLPPAIGRPEIADATSAGLVGKHFHLSPIGVAQARHHHHSHDHASAHSEATGYLQLVGRIEQAQLSKDTAFHALGILRILATAEAAVHGTSLEVVHFHEVGDWDSLMDVVAAGSIAAALPGFRWSVSSLPRGSGFVRTAHGQLPVPAPATMAILTGFAWRDDDFPGERVTPTGAAIIRHLCSEGVASGSLGRLMQSGTGVGTRRIAGLPNILRATAFDIEETVSSNDEIAVISFEVDDMTGEEIAVAMERLRSVSGVVDASTSLRAGKKGRSMINVRLLVEPSQLRPAMEACFAQSSTIGLRWRIDRREVLRRDAGSVGSLRVKTVWRPGGVRSAKVESDDLAGGETLVERRRLARLAETKTFADEDDT
jgi:uncharacterized protein (TIGR00299 family) protein